MDAADYAGRYGPCSNDGPSCGQCPNKGRLWGCPPLQTNPLLVALEQWPGASLRLMAFRGPRQDAPRTALDDFRSRIDTYMLSIEEPGTLAFFSGSCTWCPPGQCTRPQGAPCPHPDRARTSLQACGINVAQTAADILGLPLQWDPQAKTIFVTALLISKTPKQ